MISFCKMILLKSGSYIYKYPGGIRKYDTDLHNKDTKKKSS